MHGIFTYLQACRFTSQITYGNATWSNALSIAEAAPSPSKIAALAVAGLGLFAFKINKQLGFFTALGVESDRVFPISAIASPVEIYILRI
ncbi:hypothetical protein [Microcoleus sp. Pol17_C1]|uniref:hypothetical protein n=1 Tax=unclassified Microcoleus TaxID=2642155 RepID=UPI002FD3FBE9